MRIAIFQVDAFTNVRFKGNPAAVCLLDEWISDDLMQHIAAENNLSETAFFIKTKEGFHIRWFTPVTEVDLCGHATLATAAVIFEKLDYKLDKILFQSKSGMLTVGRREDDYILNFPTDKITQTETDPSLHEALGIAPLKSFKGREDFLLIYENEQQIRDLTPDFNKLAAITQRGVIVSAPGNEFDFVSRFFAPAVGIEEDPVTGSAHTSLTPYWAEELGKESLTAKQLSQREGMLRCTHKGDRTEIAGKVAFYLEGIIQV